MLVSVAVEDSEPVVLADIDGRAVCVGSVETDIVGWLEAEGSCDRVAVTVEVAVA